MASWLLQSIDRGAERRDKSDKLKNMALKGLLVTTWIGWFTGAILLRRPWGRPSFSTWWTFSTFYSIFLLVMLFVLMVDLYNNGESIVFMGETHTFGKWVKAFAIMQFAVLTLLKRIALLVNAKKLSKLMEIINRDDEENIRTKNYSGICTFMETIIIHTAFLLTFITIGTSIRQFIVDNSQRPSWFQMLGPVGFTILFALFAIVSLSVVTNCAFAIVLVLSRRVSEVFAEFCYQVEVSLPIISCEGTDDSLEIYNILQITPKIGFAKKSHLRKHKNNSVSPVAQHPVQLSKFLTRQDIIDRLDEVKDLMKLANEALSTITLFLIIGMTLGIVSNASQFVVVRHEGLLLLSDIFVVCLMALYTVILQVGHKNNEFVSVQATQSNELLTF